MRRFLQNVSIRMAVITALVFFTVALMSNVAVFTLSGQATQRTLNTLELINVKQLNAINRADALLSGARVSLEVAVANFTNGQRDQALEYLRDAAERVELSATRFEQFAAVPRTEQEEALGARVESTFTAVMDTVQQQLEALNQSDTFTFRLLRDELASLSSVQKETLTEFVRYAGQRGEALQQELDDINRFYSLVEWVILAVSLSLVVCIYFGLRAMVIRPLGQAVKALDTIADADLTQPLPNGGKNEVGRLFTAMHRMQDSLNQIVARVREGSGEIHLGTQEITSGNADLSSRTEEQAASIQQTAASMEQMTATVKQNADNALQASKLAGDASGTAENGGKVVEQVVETMQGISTSSQQVADITGLIDSIAFQTNILALNASVEAARAGEQGRGFAVVAGEVRNLASRSADAAKEIKTLIDASVTQIKEGSALVEQAGATMSDVVTSVRRVTDIMDEISAASQEQSDGIEQVSQAIGQMDEVTQQNASLVQQASAAAASLEEQANRLEEAVSVFRLSGESGSARPALSSPAPTARQTSMPPPAASLARSHSTPSSSHDDWEAF